MVGLGGGWVFRIWGGATAAAATGAAAAADTLPTRTADKADKAVPAHTRVEAGKRLEGKEVAAAYGFKSDLAVQWSAVLCQGFHKLRSLGRLEEVWMVVQVRVMGFHNSCSLCMLWRSGALGLLLWVILTSPLRVALHALHALLQSHDRALVAARGRAVGPHAARWAGCLAGNWLPGSRLGGLSHTFHGRIPAARPARATPHKRRGIRPGGQEVAGGPGGNA